MGKKKRKKEKAVAVEQENKFLPEVSTAVDVETGIGLIARLALSQHKKKEIVNGFEGESFVDGIVDVIRTTDSKLLVPFYHLATKGGKVPEDWNREKLVEQCKLHAMVILGVDNDEEPIVRGETCQLWAPAVTSINKALKKGHDVLEYKEAESTPESESESTPEPTKPVPDVLRETLEGELRSKEYNADSIQEIQACIDTVLTERFNPFRDEPKTDPEPKANGPVRRGKPPLFEEDVKFGVGSTVVSRRGSRMAIQEFLKENGPITYGELREQLDPALITPSRIGATLKSMVDLEQATIL